jgi:hypothetical protein
MNREHLSTDDWGDLQAAWQTQAVAAPDMDALRHEIAGRDRRLRALRLAERTVAAISLANCARALFLHEVVPLPVPMIVGFMILVAGYTVWAEWQRRKQWRAVALEPAALVDFEHARTRTSLRIWRVSTWLALGVWIAFVFQALLSMDGASSAPPVPAWAWALSVGLNALVVLLAALVACALGRRWRRRLHRLEAMRAALDAG